MTKLQIVIPMAGRGRRFAEAGYDVPKPFIALGGVEMWRVVALNLPRHGRRVLLSLEEHRSWLPDEEGDIVVRVGVVTEGAACTLLLSEEHVDADAPLLVANADQWLDWSSEHFASFVEHDGCDGAIVTFRASGPKWSYADVREDGTIAEVAEKVQISHDATCGLYWWRRAGDCFGAIRSMIEKGVRVNNEFYLCPSYNEMILDGARIIAYPVPRMWGMGTPEDLQRTMEAYPWR